MKVQLTGGGSLLLLGAILLSAGGQPSAEQYAQKATGDAPTFTITGTSDPDGPGGNILRQVDGQLTNVPCYLDQESCPPFSRFSYAPGADDPTLAPTSFASWFTAAVRWS